KCSDGGSCLCCSASAVLISPVTPAAASRWPTFVFTDPSAQNCCNCVDARNTCVSAATSIGSPSSVPVPCASTYVTVSGLTFAIASPCAITSACPLVLG